MNNAHLWRPKRVKQRELTFARFCNLQRERIKAALAPKYGEDDDTYGDREDDSTWVNTHQDCAVETRGSTLGSQKCWYAVPRVK